VLNGFYGFSHNNNKVDGSLNAALTVSKSQRIRSRSQETDNTPAMKFVPCKATALQQVQRNRSTGDIYPILNPQAAASILAASHPLIDNTKRYGAAIPALEAVGVSLHPEPNSVKLTAKHDGHGRIREVTK
jgi:hypothetical protein